MANNKNNHYVPQFHIKNFSTDRTCIALFNIGTQLYVPTASIKGQSSEDYFYSKDPTIEKELSQLENDTAPIISNIIKTGKLPSADSEGLLMLRIFTLVQAGRTKEEALALNETVDKITKEVYGEDERVKGFINDFTFGYEYPALIRLKNSVLSLPYILDLECRLLVNETDKPFITSDNPVVKYNQFLEKRKHPGAILGLISKGLQIFYPISPKHCLAFYDPAVYHVGTRKQRVIITKDRKDVFQLNMLQLINAESHLYFDSSFTREDAVNLYDLSVKHLNPERVDVGRYPQQPYEDDKSRTLITMHSIKSRIKLALSFIKESYYALNYKMTGYAVEYRNEKLRHIPREQILQKYFPEYKESSSLQ